jgi:hypothetical protein
METPRKEDAVKVLADFLERSPYTTPEGKILSGREDVLEFVTLFFPEEAGELEDE